MRKLRNEDDFNELIRNVRAASALLAWAEAGHLQTLLEGAVKLESLEGDSRALEITAEVLALLGVVQRHGDEVMLTPAAADMVRSGVFADASGSRLLGDLGRLREVIARGGPVHNEQGEERDSRIGVRESDPESVRTFMEMLDRRSVNSAAFTADAISAHLPEGASVLDLGGGHGRYGREFAHRGHPSTLFDLPSCIALARERHGSALDYRAGDFFKDELGGPYGAILMSNIVHGLGEDQIVHLLERAGASLSSDGLIVVKDMFIDPMGSGPDNAVVFGMVMLLYTQQGRSYRLDRLTALARRAGLEPASVEYSSAADFALAMYTPA